MNSKWKSIQTNRPGSSFIAGKTYPATTEGTYGEIDGLFVERTRLIIFESKQGLLKTSVKFGSCTKDLRNQINSKLVGTAQTPAGITQLRRNIERVLRDWRSLGLSCKPQAIYPILIVEDIDFASKPLSTYLKTEAQSVLAGLPSKVHPLNVMTPDCLNVIVERSTLIAPSQLLWAEERSQSTAFTLAQRIAEQFPLEMLPKHGSLSKDARNFPLSEEAMEGVLENAMLIFEVLCPECTARTIRNARSGAWVCTANRRHPVPTPNSGELDRQQSQRIAAVKWYEDSRGAQAKQ